MLNLLTEHSIHILCPSTIHCPHLYCRVQAFGGQLCLEQVWSFSSQAEHAITLLYSSCHRITRWSPLALTGTTSQIRYWSLVDLWSESMMEMNSNILESHVYFCFPPRLIFVMILETWATLFSELFFSYGNSCPQACSFSSSGCHVLLKKWLAFLLLTVIADLLA